MKLALRELFGAPTISELSAQVARLLYQREFAPNFTTVTQTTTEDLLSLRQLLDPQILADPCPLYRRLRTEAPVLWDPYLHVWVVTRYEDVVTVLTRFSADRTPSREFFETLGAPQGNPIAKVMVKQMLFVDAPAHARLRTLTAHAFVPSRLRVLRDHIEKVALRLIDDVQARGTGRMELLSDFADLLPSIATAGDAWSAPCRRSPGTEGLDRSICGDARQPSNTTQTGSTA